MILTICEQALLALPLIIGAYITVSLMKLPDLSLESSYLFGATLGGLMVQYGCPLPLIITASITGGALVGMTSSVLNQLFRIPFLLSAIITNGLYHGITLFVMQKPYISLGAYSNPFFNTDIFSHHPELGFLVFIGICLIAIMSVALKTQLGYAFAIYGNNPKFFVHYGIDTGYIVISGVAIAGSLSGFSGYLFAQSNGFVDMTMGYGTVLLAITALILGKMVLQAKKTTLFVPFLGVLLYFTLQQLLLKVGFNLKYFNSIQALIVLGALYSLSQRSDQGVQKLTDHLGV